MVSQCTSGCRSALRPGMLVLLLAVVHTEVTGQVVQGRVMDAESDRSVPSATVVLLDGEEGDRIRVSVATDEEGRFLVRAPATGTYRLRVDHIGHRAVTTAPFDLISGTPPLEVDLLLGTDVIPLAPMIIVSERPARLDLRLHNRGFYERRDTWGREGMGFGHFLDRTEIDRRNPAQVVDLLRDIPGVRIEPRGGRLAGEITMRAVTSISAGGLRCSPLIFVDGVLAATGSPEVGVPGMTSDMHIDDLVSVVDLAGIEVYPGLTQPAEFLRGHHCGVIVLWTGGGDRRPSGRAFSAFRDMGGPLGVELRIGTGIGDFAPTGGGMHVAPGVQAAVLVDWRLLPRLALSTGLGYGTFGCSEGHCRDVDARFETLGWSIGLRGHLDVRGGPWARVGMGSHRLGTRWEADGETRRRSAPYGFGLEAATGLRLPLGRSISLTPGVGMARWSAPDPDRGPFPSAWWEPSDRVVQVNLTVGLRFGF